MVECSEAGIECPAAWWNLVESGGTSTHIDSPVIGGLIWINMMNQWESAKRSSTNPGNFGKLFHPTTSINSI
jgi:hypothetical protein